VLRQHQTRRPQPGSGNDPVSGIIDVYGKSLLALFDSVSHAVDSTDRS
jgi:hypothetical protein